jgi:hypothetical protein
LIPQIHRKPRLDSVYGSWGRKETVSEITELIAFNSKQQERSRAFFQEKSSTKLRKHYEDEKWDPFEAPLILYRLPRTLRARGFRNEEEFPQNLGPGFGVDDR